MIGKGTAMVRNNRGIFVFVVGIILLLSLVGCKSTSGQPPTQQPAKSEAGGKNNTESTQNDQDKPVNVKVDNQEKTLRVVYYLEEQFMREYGNAYKKKYPNTKIQVIPSLIFQGGVTTSIKTEDILEQKPDVIYGSLVFELAQSRKLLDLTPYMRQHGLEREYFAKPAIEWLENLGMGQLIALSPSFYTEGLYYNKTLFDELKIPYPSNDLSWEHLLRLAEEISRKDSERTVYGLYMDEAANRTLSSLAAGLGVESTSEDRRTSLFYSDDYRTAISRIVDAFRMNAIYLPPEQNERGRTKKEHFLQNMFIAGEAAMTIRHPGLINDLIEAPSLGIDSFAWDILPVPSDPLHPGQTTRVNINDAFSIYSGSENKAAAWEFIQFVIGPEMAAELANTKPSVLSIRMDANKQRLGRELDAFFAHRPFSSNHIVPLPPEAGQRISPIATQTFLDILYGRTSVSHGLESLHSDVQHILDQAWAESKKE